MTATTRRPSDTDEFWYERKMDESLNRWFATYDDALASLREMGGFLLPFRHQFVVVEDAAIRALGLDPGDPDWHAIGHNVVSPADREAYARLNEKRAAFRRERHEH